MTQILADKYRDLKKTLREVLEENEFLASKLWKFKTKLMAVERERDNLMHLLKKNGLASAGSADLISDSDDSVGVPTAAAAAKMATTSTTPQAAGTATAGAVPAAIKKEGKETRKRRPVTSKTTRIQPYPTSESGSPILPLTAGVMTILELGEIVHDRPAYHAERYIYPVGYKSKRSFLSMIDAAKQTMYLCEVLDGGDSPMFVVTPEDCPERAVSAGSLTGAWIPIFKAAYALRNKEHASGLSGPEFFGFTQGIVMKVIQELPGSRLCKNYVWQEFEFIQSRKRAGKSDESGAKKAKNSKAVGGNIDAPLAKFESTDSIASSVQPVVFERRSSRYDDDDLDGDDEDDDLDANDATPIQTAAQLANVIVPSPPRFPAANDSNVSGGAWHPQQMGYSQNNTIDTDSNDHETNQNSMEDF